MKILTGLAFTFFAVMPLPSVQAQEHEGCFMIQSGGRVVDLTAICPQRNAPVPSTASTSSGGTLQYEDPSTANPASLAAYYASKYCDWREAGGRSREESNRHARSELTTLLINLYGTDGASNVVKQQGTEIFRQTDSAIQVMCPNDM